MSNVSAKLFVTDASVFSHVIDLGLEVHFFRLPNIVTSDFIMHEYLTKRPSRYKLLAEQVQLKRMEVWPLDEIQIAKIFSILEVKQGLTHYDCSVFVLAESNKGILLADDKLLRTHAQDNGVEVHGLIYCLDMLIELKSLSMIDASAYIRKWIEIDPRAPRRLLEGRLKQWEV